MYNPVRMIRQSWRQSRQARTISGLPARRQFGEVLTPRRVVGMSRAEYYAYRLWRPDLSFERRLEFTSLRERRISRERVSRAGRPGCDPGMEDDSSDAPGAPCITRSGC
jgi:hypothetical protein